MAKLLIDECLHTSLLKLAHEAGHTADHVNYLGLGSSKDWDLMDPCAACQVDHIRCYCRYPSRSDHRSVQKWTAEPLLNRKRTDTNGAD